MNRNLERLIRRIIVTGNLQIKDHKGAVYQFGDNRGPVICMHIRSRRYETRLILDPELALGQGFTDGDIVLERGSIYDVLEIIWQNLGKRPYHLGIIPRLLSCWRYVIRRLEQWNFMYRAKRNVAHHYDLNYRFYRLFLDDELQYSCAFFGGNNNEGDIDAAQKQKMHRLAAKLCIDRPLRILDIGCGWGGLGLFLAGHFSARVDGVTLSTEQHQLANKNAHGRGLSERAKFHLQDYRSLTGRYHRIVSVGMFEHVGINHYQTYFNKCQALLDEDGIMLLHTMVRLKPPSRTSAWIKRYIFPGGYIPALSEIIPAIEKSGLVICDLEIQRLHYAKTIRLWRERFLSNWQKASKMYDNKFCRMWEFYLAASESALRHANIAVGQFQLAKKMDAVPITRNYISQTESRLRALDQSAAEKKMAGE